jgi:hypothetical protein
MGLGKYHLLPAGAAGDRTAGGAGRPRFRPSFEQLETREVLSASYTLSPTGVLSSVANGQASPILTQVKRFGVDVHNDVFAERRAGGRQPTNDMGNNIEAFGLDPGQEGNIPLTSEGAYAGAIVVHNN